MFTKKFWKDLAERTVRTFAQGAAAFVTAAGIDLIKADAKTVLYGGLIAGGYAVVTSLVAAFKNPEQQSASLLDQPVATVPGHHDGTQAPYDPASESYVVVSAEEQERLAASSLEYADGPTDLPPPPYQAQSLITDNKPIPQRGPNGRFLPRNQGDF